MTEEFGTTTFVRADKMKQTQISTRPKPCVWKKAPNADSSIFRSTLTPSGCAEAVFPADSQGAQPDSLAHVKSHQQFNTFAAGRSRTQRDAPRAPMQLGSTASSRCPRAAPRTWYLPRYLLPPGNVRIPPGTDSGASSAPPRRSESAPHFW